MIKKEFRLTKNRYFQYIYRKGEAKHTEFLSLVFVKTKLKPFKVGFSVSKKIGKSVVRSKVKRRMTEAFNLLQTHFNGGYNYVFIAKTGIEKLSLEKIRQETEKVLKKAGLFI